MPGAVVEVEGRRLELTNLDKVLYPEAGWTKAHVIDYYRRIAPVLLPHLKGRALTLKRYPDGVEGSFFYEKTCPPHRPDWVRTAPVYSRSRGEEIPFCVVDDLPTLVWAANLADLEMHTHLACADAPDTPTSIVFDLDPGPGTDILDCGRIALRLRDVLAELGLASFPKTSGSKGIQLHVPLNTPATYEATKPFARAVGEMLEREQPERATTNMRKSLREGRVLIDWSQNAFHKTTVCAYSLRANAQPTVSTPITWQEIGRALDAQDAGLLVFRADDVLARVADHGDLYRDVLEMEQALPALA